jgi:Ni/Fe-hydrogenase subunit HybB-like protein
MSVLLVLMAAAAVTVLLRFLLGLGRVTAMNDGYPWGLWIAFDVVTGTALACGGYAVGILAYVLNQGRYHPVVRGAVLTSALGYTMAGVSVGLDIGRPWTAWKVPLEFWNWNLNSILLEVALCIMAYMAVAWIELAPAFLERAAVSPRPGLQALARTWLPRLERALPFLLAFGLLLPTMHQSSLGTLIYLAGPRLHPLWSTSWLPLLFLVSCLSMGYAAVVFESTLAARFFSVPRETRMLARLGRVTAALGAALVAFRLADLAISGRLRAFALDVRGLVFAVEIVLAVVAASVLWRASGRRSPRGLFQGAMLLLLAAGLYRFDAYLVAFQPGEHWSYFPNVPEILVTVGVVAFEIAAYIVIVKLFPILRRAES